MCCQKVSEAEALVQAGVPDVLVSNQVVGRRKIAHLVALSREARVGVCVDDAGNATEIGKAAAAGGVTIDALVEIDVGAGRCGVPPGAEALALARRVASTDGLRFAGLQAYHGSAQHIRDYAERGRAIDSAASMTRTTVESLAREGIECETVAGAGTGTWQFEAASGVYNELQAGSYIFMDVDYAKNLDASGAPFTDFEHSLFVHSTVMSRPVRERAVLDAGLKAFATDCGMPRLADIESAPVLKAVRRARGGGSDRLERKRRCGRQGSTHPRPLRPDREPPRLVRLRARRPGGGALADRGTRLRVVARSHSPSSIRSLCAMPLLPLIEYEDAGPEVRAVFDDIMSTRVPTGSTTSGRCWPTTLRRLRGSGRT